MIGFVVQRQIQKKIRSVRKGSSETVGVGEEIVAGTGKSAGAAVLYRGISTLVYREFTKNVLTLFGGGQRLSVRRHFARTLDAASLVTFPDAASYS